MPVCGNYIDFEIEIDSPINNLFFKKSVIVR